MNRHLHRLVFNRSRGQMMVVQETASSVSGAADGGTSKPAIHLAAARSTRPVSPQALREVAWAVICSLSLSAWVPIAAAQTAALSISASPTAAAGQRPIVDAAPNGVPIVHIAPPSAAGVSRNQFQQFNVDANGLILNNSSANVQTQIGGWIGANPQLGYVPARIIVNEVVGSAPSQLKGTIEVAGRKADIVIANPNGLFCDGCNFINTGRATLSTGAPQYDAQGALKGFDVRQGQIAVGASGLNATHLEQLDLIARGLVIDGEVWAQNLNVLAGANQVLYASLGVAATASAQAGNGAAPRFAIDVKDLGGMYANQVYLIATERGLGVNSTGRVAALQGNLELLANGDLTLKDSYAKQDLHLSGAGSIALTGQSQSGDATRISGSAALTNAGTLDSAGGLTLQAASITNSGTLIARGAAPTTIQTDGALINSGAVFSAPDLSLSARSIDDRNGSVQAAGALSATARSITLSGTRLASNGVLTLAATGGDLATDHARINADAGANLSATGQVAQRASTVQLVRDISLSGAAIANVDTTVLATGALSVTTPGKVDNTGGRLMGSAALTVNAARLSNDAGVVSSGGAAQIGVGSLSNNGGVIATDASLAIDAANVSNRAGSISSGTGTVLSTQALDNAAGFINSGAALAIDTHGQALTNTAGHIGAEGSVDIKSGALLNAQGEIIANASVAVQADAAIDNTAGAIVSNGAATRLTAARVGNDQGVISGAQSAAIAATQAFSNRVGRVLGGNSVSVVAASIDNTDGIVSAQHTRVNAGTGALANARGQVIGAATLELTAGSVMNAQGVISSGADLDIDTRGAVLDNRSGQLSVAGTLNVHTAALDNSDGVISGATLGLSSEGALTNAGGRIAGAQDATITAQSLANTAGNTRAGEVLAGGNLTLTTAGTLTNHGSLIAALGGDATVSTQGATFDNSQVGTVYAKNALTVTSGAADNSQGGSLQSGAALSVDALALNNTAGLIQGGTVVIDTHGQALVNDDSAAHAVSSGLSGGILSVGNVALNTGVLSNRAGMIASAGALGIQASAAVDNRVGLMSAATGLTLNAAGQAVTNAGGTISASRGDLALQSASLNNAGGTLVSSGTTALRVGTAISNRATIGANPVAGQIGGLDVVITATALENAGGRIAADRDAGIDAARVDNSAGEVSAKHDVTLSAPTLINSTGKVLAVNAVTVRTASSALGGALAGNDLNLIVQGDFDNTSTLSASRNLSVSANNVSNSGVLTAGSTLTVQANGDLVNNTGGELSGADVHLSAAGTIANAGLINSTGAGGRASLQGASIRNTGRIYGDNVDLQAAQISNSGTGVVAARSTLNLAGQDIANSGANALLLSLGDLNAGASLDPATKQITGLTGRFTNTAGRVEADGNVVVSASTILNANGGVKTQLATVASAPQTTSIIFSGTTTAYPLAQCVGVTEGWDQPFCKLHPDVYGLRSDYAAAWETVSTGDYQSGTLAIATVPHYAWNDPIYAALNVASVSSPRPAEPGGSGACSSTGADSGITVPIDSPSCNQWRSQAGTWDSAYATVANNLQAAIAAYNADVDRDNAVVMSEDYTILKVSSTTQQTQVMVSQPGQILSGGNLQLRGTNITNIDSRIVAGGQLDVNGLATTSGTTPVAAGIGNVATQGQETTTYAGTSQYTHLDTCGGIFDKHHCRNYDGEQPYSPAPTTTTIDLATVVYRQNAAQLQGGVAQAAATPVALHTAAGAAAVNGTQVAAVGPLGNSTHASVSAAVATVSTVVSVPAAPRADQNARDMISTVVPKLAVPTSQLFKVTTAPGATYLVETDPAFTNHRTFLGSDYFEQQLQLDPQRTLKRFGDGFEEQQLVNDEVLALTGRRYLSGYQSTEDEFKALMDAGVAFAKAYQLTPGVALSADQMALLSTDIVWLTAQTVTLADGSTTQVLVPQVYVRHPQSGDLAPSGALLAGSTLAIKTPGDLVNSGSLGGTTVNASANDLINTGHVAATSDLVLRAGNDLKNLSGSITSTEGTVSLSAARDIVLQTRTLDTSAATSATNGTSSSTRSAADRIATVQAGANLLISAGRDLSIAGANLAAVDTVSATAARNLIVSAVQGSYQIDTQASGGAVTLGRTGHIEQSATTQTLGTITAGNNLGLVAAGDANLQGAVVAAGNNALIQGANVTIDAARESQSTDIQTVQKRAFDHATQSDETLVGGLITAANNLTINANGTDAHQGNVALTGASVAATNGQATLIGANDVSINAASTAHSASVESYYEHSGGIANVYTSSELHQAERSSQTTQVEGSRVSGNTVYVQAGDAAKQTGDITLSGSSLTAASAAVLNAGRDAIVQAEQQSSTQSSLEQSSKGFAIGSKIAEQAAQAFTKDLLRLDPVANKYLPPPSSSGTGTGNDTGTQTRTQSVGSSISADSLSVAAGRDATVRGSAIVTTNDLAIGAGRNLSIVTSQDRQNSAQRHTEADNGLFNSGAGLTTGTRELTQTANDGASTATTSQVASLSGNVSLTAGKDYQQTGSQVLALGQGGSGGDVSITAKTVTIDAARNTASNERGTNFQQEGVTVSLDSPIISALQGLAQTTESGTKTSDKRLQALAAATAVMQAAGVAQAIANPTVGISVDLGHSQSQSRDSQRSDSAAGSTVNAARDLKIVATGGDVNVTGSDLGAGRNATVKADGAILLQASSSTAELESRNSSQSASVGVTLGGGASNGLSIHAAASAGTGKANGSEQTFTNSHLAAGDTVMLQSGGDTTLKGAVVQGNAVKADVGGNLNVQSLQDATRYDASQKSAGVGVTLCIPPLCYGQSSVSGSASKAKANGDFLSVGEQSGIQAGDGGFQVDVKGNTDLKGGVILSTQRAIDGGKNSLSSATLTTSDLHNRDQSQASEVALSGGYSGTVGDQTSDAARQNMSEADKVAADSAAKHAGPSYAVGLGQSSTSQGSTTRSAISAGAITITDNPAQTALTGKDAAGTLTALDTQATTDSNTAGVLKKGWDGAQLIDHVQLQARITQQALPGLASTIGAVMSGKATDLRAEANGLPVDDPKRQSLLDEAARYDEGGAYRIAAHAALGALGGGTAGAVGAGAAAAAAPTLNDLQYQLAKSLLDSGMSDSAAVNTARLLTGAGAAALGGAVGGTAGAVTAGNADFNNRQLHPSERQRIQALANGDKAREARLTVAACALVQCSAQSPTDSAQYKEAKALEDLGNSPAFAADRQLLAKQTDVLLAGFGQNVTISLFNYSKGDVLGDGATRINNTYQFTTRLLGGIQMVGGVATTVGGAAVVAAGGASCPATGVGCVVAAGGVATIAYGADTGYAGAKTLVEGKPSPTLGGTLIQQFGASPEIAELVYGLIGLAPAAVDSALASKAANAFAEANTAARKTYADAVNQEVRVVRSADGTASNGTAAYAIGKDGQAIPSNLYDASSGRYTGVVNDSGGSLLGAPTRISLSDDAATARALVLENGSAVKLAQNGYKVEQNPVVSGTTKNPDYLVNGEVFDAYSPSTGNVRNIAKTIEGKVTSGQADNVVLNLTESSATTSAIQDQLTQYPVPGLKRVIVIDQSGSIVELKIP